MNTLEKLKPENLVFSEPRLLMNMFGRFVIRLITYCGYALLGATTAVFLLSDAKPLFWVGIFGLIFSIDRLFYVGEAEKSLIELNAEEIKDGQKINTAQYLSPASFLILEKAMEKSLITGNGFHLHLAKFLIENRDVQEGLMRMDVPLKEFGQKIDGLIKEEKTDSKISREDLINKIGILSKIAFGLGLNGQGKFIEPVNIFSALTFIGDEKINRVVSLFSISPNDLDNALIFGRFRKKFKWLGRLPLTLGGFAHKTYRTRHRIMNRAWTARPTPTLDNYSTDYTDIAREETIGFMIGHQKEYEQLVDILSRPNKANTLLIGDPGSGKETIINHLAFNIIKDKVPPPLFDKRLVGLHIGNLISGASPEEVSARVNRVLNEIVLAGNVILYIPDIHNLVKTSGSQYLSAADILIPVITSDAFPVIGATFPKEFKLMIEPQTDFSGAFDTIRVEEIKEDEAVKLLTFDSVILEQQYKIIVSFGAIKQSVYLAHKYFKQKLLPSSAEDLLKEALADASQKQSKVLSADDIISIAERKTNIPIHKTGREEAEKLLNLENIIHERLIDQEQAVKAVSQAFREYRSGLARTGGPIAVFLFVGPTGVGKTELAKILTKIQFGAENMMVRFDMSEYQDKQSIFRFIGSPDGKMAGNLTESIIQKPHSLILLDEFEKANPDILNLFLQVFDDGRLTDNLSRTIDFTNTVIIATSNAHSEFIKNNIEAHTPIETIAEELKKKLTDYFRPELLNRFSNIIVFKPHSLDDIGKIAKLQLQDLARSLSETQGINLSFDETVVKKIAELGYDPAFGARPLRNAISENLRGPLAEKILKEEIIKGSNVKVSLENGEFKFA